MPLFLLFTVFEHSFIDFEYFTVILGAFLAFWKKIEIHNGGFKMAAVLTS